jgi:hypothetical protein
LRKFIIFSSPSFLFYLESDGDNRAADLFPDHKLLAKHGHDEVLPAPGRETLAEANDPLAAETIGIILQKKVRYHQA